MQRKQSYEEQKTSDKERRGRNDEEMKKSSLTRRKEHRQKEEESEKIQTRVDGEGRYPAESATEREEAEADGHGSTAEEAKSAREDRHNFPLSMSPSTHAEIPRGTQLHAYPCPPRTRIPTAPWRQRQMQNCREEEHVHMHT